MQAGSRREGQPWARRRNRGNVVAFLGQKSDERCPCISFVGEPVRCLRERAR